MKTCYLRHENDLETAMRDPFFGTGNFTEPSYNNSASVVADYVGTLSGNTSVSGDVNVSSRDLTFYRDGWDDSKIQLYVYYLTLTERTVSLIGLLLNVSTCVTLLTLKGSLKTQLKLILSLSLSDGVIAVYHLLLTYVRFPNIWSILKFSMRDHTYQGVFINVLYSTAQFAGLSTMSAISIDVFLKVHKPLRYKVLMSKRRGNIMIACFWVTPCLIYVAIATCLYHIPNFVPATKNMFVFFNFFYFLCCVLFFFFFVIIYSITIYSINTFMQRQPSSYRHGITKTAVTVCFIITSYFVFVMPVLLIILSEFLWFSMDYEVCLLYVVNTICDPVIYAFRIPEIKAQYRIIFRKLFRCKTRGGDNNI